MDTEIERVQAEKLEEQAIDIYNRAVGSSIDTQRSCVRELKDLYKKYRTDNVANYYAMALFNLSLCESCKQQISISEDLQELFTINPTKAVAVRLGRIKCNLAFIQRLGSKDLKRSAVEIEKLYSLYPTYSLAEPLAKIWHCISISSAKDRLEYEKKIIALCSGIHAPYTNSAYAYVLFNSKNEIEDREKLIDSFLSDIQTIESFGCYLESEYYPKHNAALKDFRLEDSSPFDNIGTKINEYFNQLKNHSNFENLKAESLAILFYTIQIKKLLIVPKTTKAICHYTKAENIKHLIKEPDVDGKLRMYNASYMNDPEEGSVLQKFLSDDKSDETMKTAEYHNIYLSCFTTEVDSLPMWSLYGNDGQGCCLVLSPDYFDYPQNEYMDDSLLDIAADTDSNCLYRVCYLTCDKNELEIDRFPKDSPKLINHLGDIVSALKYHYKAIQRLRNDNGEKKVDELVTFILGQIAYLFKDQSYHHEHELRLIRYSETPSLDNDSWIVPQLYVQVPKPLKYNKVILGPKTNEPNRIIPYMLYSKKIKHIELSKIKYR